MTTEQQYILQILSSSLQNEKCKTPPPSTLDWDALLAEAVKQGVCFLCYYGMDKAFIPEKTKWEYSANQALWSNMRVMEAHARVCKLLEENDIPTVCLKGYSSAYYYPKPEYRMMGDVDFFVDEGLREKAKNVLAANGYQGGTVGHHDWHYQKSGITYELHFAISGVPQGKEGEPFLREFKDLIRDRKWADSRVGKIAVPSDYHHGLIILLHTASHLMGGGLGLRHLYDWAAFANHFGDEEFSSLFEKKMTELRIWRFAQVLTAVCEKHLGLKKHAWAEEIEPADDLIEEFLKSGDFGEKNRHSDLMASEGFSVRVGNKSELLNMIAVLRNSVERQWPKTKENKALLAVYMMYSAVRYCFRMITGKREKLNLLEMSREANERRKLYRGFGLVEGIEDNQDEK